MSALVLLVLAAGLFEKNDPLVDQGTEAFEAQKFDEALTHFEAAARERPSDARVHFNLGATLHKLGRNAEAKQALTKAEELDGKHEFTNQIQYNRGTIAAGEGLRDEAMKAFRRALRADPADALARHNLEVLLRNVPPKQPPTPDAGADGGQPPADAGPTHDAGAPRDAGRPDGGPPSDAGPPGDAGHGDAGLSDGGQGDQPVPGGDGGQQSGHRGDGGFDGGAATDGGLEDQPDQQSVMTSDAGFGLSRQEAEKALDSMKSGEKNLQLWRFKKQTKKNENHGKDW